MKAETFEVPHVAEIPRPKSWSEAHPELAEKLRQAAQVPEPQPEPPPPPPDPEPAPPDDEHEVIKRAAVQLDRYAKQRQQLEIQLTETTLALKARDRQIEALTVDVMEGRNNLAAVQSQLQEMRQEVSDCRAFFSSMRAQFDHFEIPLPIRRKAKNGKQPEA